MKSGLDGEREREEGSRKEEEGKGEERESDLEVL
jgi:hypothetical protein